MSSWRDQILKEFTPKVAKLTLVADPDGLLFEERILEVLYEKGTLFEILFKNDEEVEIKNMLGMNKSKLLNILKGK